MQSKVSMDGVGHTVRTELTSDPDGATITETIFDGNGRVWKQFNPYRSSGDPTYGITQTEYDSLGRTRSVVKPDGSTSYTEYNGNQTTVKDEAGHQRRSTTDALGRLIEVDEPGVTGAPASAGSGSVTVSGTEQSTQVLDTPAVASTGTVQLLGGVQWKAMASATTGGTTNITISGAEQQYPAGVIPGTGFVAMSGSEQSKITHAATSGYGSVTINGSLQSKQLLNTAAISGWATIAINGTQPESVSFNACPNQYPYYCPYVKTNIGTIYVTVNGFQAFVGWGPGSSTTNASVTATLAASLNASSSPVIATVSGSTITITAKAAGIVTNYSLSTSNNWDNYFSCGSPECHRREMPQVASSEREL